MGAPSQVGIYVVESEVGRGGMGVVYRARDPRLDRLVAIKVLPDEFSGDASRLSRLDREARALASLSHPNVATIYGLEVYGASRFLVMEFLEGRTLSSRLQGGRLPMDEALSIGAQIASGVEARSRQMQAAAAISLIAKPKLSITR